MFSIVHKLHCGICGIYSDLACTNVPRYRIVYWCYDCRRTPANNTKVILFHIATLFVAFVVSANSRNPPTTHFRIPRVYLHVVVTWKRGFLFSSMFAIRVVGMVTKSNRSYVICSCFGFSVDFRKCSLIPFEFRFRKRLSVESFFFCCSSVQIRSLVAFFFLSPTRMANDNVIWRMFTEVQTSHRLVFFNRELCSLSFVHDCKRSFHLELNVLCSTFSFLLLWAWVLYFSVYRWKLLDSLFSEFTIHVWNVFQMRSFYFLSKD